MPVQVVCDDCTHFHQLHAFNLVRQIATRADGRALPLFTPIKGLFYCRGCRSRVSATINAPTGRV
jgi:hypothetical protein